MHCALLPFLYKRTLDSRNTLPLSLQFRYEPRRADSLITRCFGVPPLVVFQFLRDPKISDLIVFNPKTIPNGIRPRAFGRSTPFLHVYIPLGVCNAGCGDYGGGGDSWVA